MCAAILAQRSTYRERHRINAAVFSLSLAALQPMISFSER